MKMSQKANVKYVKKCDFCPGENQEMIRDFHKFSPQLFHSLWGSLWISP